MPMRSWFLLLVVSVGWAFPAKAQPVDLRPVAVVGTDTIPATEFLQAYVLHLTQTGEPDTPNRRQAFLGAYTDTYVMAREARRLGFDRTRTFEEALDARIQLAAAGRYYERTLLERLPPPSDSLLRRAYAHSQTTLLVTAARFATLEEAQDARRRVDEGTPFGVIAVGQHPELAETQGQLPPMTYFSVEDAFAEAAWNMLPHVVSQPVLTRRGWYLIRVDEVVAPAFLAEDHYEVRRDGIQSQVVQRIRRLEGDRFVQREMQEAQVRFHPDALARVAEVRENPLTISQDERPASRPTPRALATYRENGRERTFTDQDFRFWLNVLIREDSTAQPATLLRQALRNHIFAQRGLAANAHLDPEAQVDVRIWTAQTLAQTFETRVQTLPARTPSEDDLYEAFLRTKLGEIRDEVATFTAVPVGSLEEGQALIASDTLRHLREAVPVRGGVEADAASLYSMPEWQAAVRRSLGSEPYVYGRPDGWFAIQVDERTSTPRYSFEQIRPLLERQLAGPLTLLHTVRELRAQTSLHLFPEVLHDLFSP